VCGKDHRVYSCQQGGYGPTEKECGYYCPGGADFNYCHEYVDGLPGQAACDHHDNEIVCVPNGEGPIGRWDVVA